MITPNFCPKNVIQKVVSDYYMTHAPSGEEKNKQRVHALLLGNKRLCQDNAKNCHGA